MEKTFPSNIVGKLKKQVRKKLEFALVEESKKVCKSKLTNKMLCMVISYTHHYHKAIAIMSQLSVKVIKMLDDSENNYIQEMCEVDED